MNTELRGWRVLAFGILCIVDTGIAAYQLHDTSEPYALLLMLSVPATIVSFVAAISST